MGGQREGRALGRTLSLQQPRFSPGLDCGLALLERLQLGDGVQLRERVAPRFLFALDVHASPGFWRGMACMALTARQVVSIISSSSLRGVPMWMKAVTTSFTRKL